MPMKSNLAQRLCGHDANAGLAVTLRLWFWYLKHHVKVSFDYRDSSYGKDMVINLTSGRKSSSGKHPMVCQYPGSNVEVMSEADPGLIQ